MHAHFQVGQERPSALPALLGGSGGVGAAHTPYPLYLSSLIAADERKAKPCRLCAIGMRLRSCKQCVFLNFGWDNGMQYTVFKHLMLHAFGVRVNALDHARPSAHV